MPMFLATPSSASSSIASHVSRKGTLATDRSVVSCSNLGVEGTLTGVAFAIKSPPLWRVLVLGLNILEGDGEVNEVQIEVVYAPELELVFGDFFCLDSK